MDLCTCSRVSKVVEDHNNLLTQCTYDFTGFQTRTWEQLFIVYFKRPNIILGAHFSSLIFLKTSTFEALYILKMCTIFFRSEVSNKIPLNSLIYSFTCTYMYVQCGPSMMSLVNPYPFIESIHTLLLSVWIDSTKRIRIESRHHWRSTLYVYVFVMLGDYRDLPQPWTS